MEEQFVFELLRGGLQMATSIAAPVLIAALVSGLVIGLFQALTSVQEMTLTFVPKLGVILLVFWLTMGSAAVALVRFFDERVVALFGIIV